MLRAFVLGTVLFAGCSSKSEATPPVVTANAKAGVVVDVTGKVTATRGGVARDLAKGGEVFGDDVIATPADGSIAIQLAHNNARWNLGAGKTGKVSESVAWTLPKAEAVAGSVEGDSSAAGRHAERSSVETAASANGAANVEPRPMGGEAGSGAVDEGRSPGGTNAPTKVTTTTKSGGATGTSSGGKSTSGGGGGTKTGDKDGVTNSDELGQGGLGLKGTGPGGGGTGDGIGLGSIGTIGRGGGTGTGTGYGTGGGKLGGSHTTKAPTIKPGTTTVSGKLPTEVVQRIVRAHVGQIRFCYETSLKKDPALAGKVDVKFVIDREGTVTNVAATGVNDELDACVAAKFKTFTFPKPEDGIVTVLYPITFAPGE